MGLGHRSAALALCCLASVAHAHAPLARGLAVASDGAVALRMPGFGWLLRKPSSFAGKPVFEYACDALVGVSPLEERAPMAYRSDGALLVGSASGLRVLTPEGCPAGEPRLSGASVTALAVHATDVDRIYAVTETGDLPPLVQRSDDGGEHWAMAAVLDAYPVSALILDDGDPRTLYVSQTTATHRSSVAVSNDGGATFETFEQDRDLTLLRAQAEPRRLWARARVPDAPAGVSILRAERAEGPWEEVLTVNFFGGLAIDPDDGDVIWAGDEARGVFRSNDGGDSFEETQPSIASACLVYGADALWSCTPGLPAQTALVRSPDAIEAFDPIMAFADVDHLVDCGAAVDVEQVCAAAWVEWRRDILALPPELPDAGVIQVNEPDAAAIASDAAVEADAAEAPASPPPSVRHDSGCAVIAARRAPSPRPLLSLGSLCTLAALSLVARRRSRHTRRHVHRQPVAS